MSRSKYQRPEVYATGKREKLWKGEWREYVIGADGKERARHKSKTWSRANFTKAQAQAALDALLREQQQGGPKRDGSMSLKAFWDEVYFPTRSGQWGINSRNAIGYIWRRNIEPALGQKPLKEITKADIALHLVKLAGAGLSQGVVSSTRRWLISILEEAVDNDFIPKNPARKVTLPKCQPGRKVRSLTEDEVRRLWDTAEGRDYLLWRVLLLTGARIGEVLALTREDLLPNGLLIDESALNAKPSTTKNKKVRLVPIPASLRDELGEWIAAIERHLLFTTPTGRMHRRNDIHMLEVLERARTAAKIPDLRFQMCRTTFATLFQGDIRDAQDILGHHSPEFTLMVYRKPISARQQTAIEELDGRLNVVPIRRGA